MFRPIDGKLEIEYPCTWIYKIFGTDRARMREAACGIPAGHDCTVTPSHSSRHNRYHCMNVAVTVSSEEDRKRVYNALQGHEAIILVL